MRLAWFEALLAKRGHQRCRWRSLAAHLPARAGLHVFKLGELLVLPPSSMARCAAVVAEVNNTFGERHCYLLAGPELAFGAEQRARKVFHVSPFCSTEGSTASASSARRWPAGGPRAHGRPHRPARQHRPAAADLHQRRAADARRAQHAPRLLRHALDDGRAWWRRRPMACRCACGSSACPSSTNLAA